MRVRKITSLQRWLCYWLLLFATAGFAQTASSVSPTKVTQRATVTIQGSGFTTNSRVRFYPAADGGGTAADASLTQTIYVSPTVIQAILPALSFTAGSTNTASLRVAASSATGAALSAPVNFQYVAPVNIGNASRVSEIITNWAHTPQGSSTARNYWKSVENTPTGGGSTSAAQNRPDNSHSVMAFRYGGNGTIGQGTMYSTGGALASDANTITNVLTSAGYSQGPGNTANTYVQGNFRALPVKNILGVVPNSGPNLIVLGRKVDGNASAQVATAPNVAGLTVRDVLIDGVRGLNIGTGVTNLPSTSVLTFSASGIVQEGINDAVPDILVSQIAEPSDSSFSIYCFTDEAGNIVGVPVQVAFNSITPIGSYWSDFFTLPAGQPLNSAHVNGALIIGNPFRDIRMVAYKLIDFGISTSNAGDATTFKVMPSGTSDPAFMAYNRNSFTIPAPEITTQPNSQAVCPGGQAVFSVNVTALGSSTEPNEYQWYKNGEPLVDGNGVDGANGPQLTITGVNASHAGAYRCLVTNNAGAALSNIAYLNTVITAGNDVATCSGTSAVMEVSSLGNNPTYQWYKSATNTNTGGTAVPSNTVGGVTYNGQGATYAPPAALAAGVHYYYVVSRPAGLTCASADVTSAVMKYTVGTAATGGTITPDQSVCLNGYATVTVSNYNGSSIQWYSSSTGLPDSFTTAVTGTTTATTPTLYIASVAATTYYRATITGTCGTGTTTANSPVSKVSVNDNYIWAGTISTEWNNPGNWSCNQLPSLTTVVTIPANAPYYPHVYGISGLAKTITVEAGASVSVDPAGTLRTADGITVNPEATFTVKNNGSFIQNNAAVNNGNITVERNSNSLYRLDYTLWSSPVTGQLLQSFSAATFADRFYEYRYGTTTVAPIETKELYWGIPNAAATAFEQARGYLIRMPNIDPASGYNNGANPIVFPGIFTGVANNGTITPPVNLGPQGGATLPQTGHFYATGNPYPSPISVSDFYSGNTNRIAAGSALYFWRKKNNALETSYATLTLSGLVANNVPGQPNQGGQINAVYYPTDSNGNPVNNSSWIISPGQGFLVKTAAAGVSVGNVQFTNSMRRAASTGATATTGQPFFRTLNNSQPSRYWINLGNAAGAYSQTLVAYSEEGTLGVDYGYDGFDISDGSMRFFSKQDGQNFSIQARPQFEATDVVPMGFTVTAAGQYTIAIHAKDGVFNDGQEIYLKDNMLGTTYNLANGAYTFTTDAGNFADRFEVVYMTSTLGNPDFELNNVYVFKQNGTNTVNVNAGSLELTGIKVFDIRGRELYSAAATGNQAAVTLNIAQQVVIVEVATTAGTITRKVIF